MAEKDGVSPYPTPAQRCILWRALTALALLTLVGVAGIVFMGFIDFLSWAYPILLPLGLAVIVALVLEPAVDFVQHRGLPRRSATLSVSLLAAISFLLFWAFLLPPLVSETGSFFYKLPGWINDGVDKLQDLESLASKPAAAAAAPTNAPAASSNLSTPAPIATGSRNAAPPPPPDGRPLRNPGLDQGQRLRHPAIDREEYREPGLYRGRAGGAGAGLSPRVQLRADLRLLFSRRPG